MSEYPIIMTGESVRATLKKRKTVTRRIPGTTNSLLDGRRVGGRGRLRRFWDGLDWGSAFLEHGSSLADILGPCWRVMSTEDGVWHRVQCLYQRGDTLWVREACALIYTGEGCVHEDDLERDELCPCPGCQIEYRADSECKYPGQWPDDAGEDAECPRWRSPIHMPRRACRLTLEVISVRAEWLQDIDYAGVRAEGLDVGKVQPAFLDTSARALFQPHWDAVNAKRGYPWADNPPVWPIDYRRVEEGE